MALDTVALAATAVAVAKNLGETLTVTLNRATGHVYDEIQDVSVPTVVQIPNLDSVKYERRITVNGIETDVATYLILDAQIGQEVRADWTLEEAGDTIARRILSIERPHDTVVIINCVVT